MAFDRHKLIKEKRRVRPIAGRLPATLKDRPVADLNMTKAASMMTLMTFTSDGSEKKRITFNINRLVLSVGLAVVAWLALTEGVEQLERHQRREEAAELRPIMEKLANEGKTAASLWLVQNYFNESKARLAQLANDGNPEAMLQQGFVSLRSGDKEGGMRWLEKSAAAGYAPAIRAIQRSEREKMH